MSMNPGATTSPRASIRRPADFCASEPIAAIRPARMPTSASNHGVPVPSITRPCSITMSKTGVPCAALSVPGARSAIAHAVIQPCALAPSERDGVSGAAINYNPAAPWPAQMLSATLTGHLRERLAAFGYRRPVLRAGAIHVHLRVYPACVIKGACFYEYPLRHHRDVGSYRRPALWAEIP